MDVPDCTTPCSTGRALNAMVLVDGTASGPVRASRDMISFWGGYDPSTGIVIDRRHSLAGQCLTGTVFVLPHGKGSSTGSPVLLDALVQGNAPAAILLNRVDEIIALGAVVYEEFFGETIPIAVLADDDFAAAMEADRIEILAGGTVLAYNDEPPRRPGCVDVSTELTLSDEDRAMLDGAHGAGARIAMRIVTRMAGIQGATKLVDVSHVHVGGSIYTGPGSLQVIETLVQRGARFRVPTTINAISVDRQRWRTQRVDPDFADKADRLATGFENLGASPIFSCTPYVFPAAPRYGQDIVWAESNAIVYANSVIGARTNRHGDFLDVCAAITGRAPLAGFHLPENRTGSFLVRVPPLAQRDALFYTALGYLVGKNAGDLVPVIDGIPDTPSTEDLKAFCAAVATSGPVGMFHMVGVTPEAPTREAALGGKEPVRTLDVTTSDILDTVHGLSTGEKGAGLDLVVLGSPHFTLGDFAELASLIDGRTCDPRVDVLITTSRFVLDQAVQQGWAQTIEAFGARFSTDTCLCMLNSDMLAPSIRTVMTNSGKFAHYGPGLIQRGVWFGSLSDCVESAVSGTQVATTPAWAAT